MTSKRSHPLHNSWWLMHARCKKPNCNAYKYYGARGIKVCERWNDFWNFVADMGERPKGKTLDRINNDGDYEPSNCRWATAIEQNRNTRTALRAGHPTAKGAYKNGKKFIARIRINGKLCNLGTFPTQEEASAKYKEAYFAASCS